MCGACQAGVIALTVGLGREEQEGIVYAATGVMSARRGSPPAPWSAARAPAVAGTGRPAEAHGPAAPGTAAGPDFALAVTVRPTTYSLGPRTSTRPLHGHAPHARTRA